jgi:transposase
VGAGFLVLVSDTEMTASEAIRIIRRRDVVEHVFESIKRHFDLSVTYTHSVKTYRGKMFAAFIASILFATLTWDLREVLHDKTSATIAFEMMELNKYKVELQSDGSWYPSYAMSRIQKELISKVGLTEDEAINQATEIKLLV